MAIVWNDLKGKFEYDNQADQGKNNEAEFKLHVLNTLAGINDNLNDIANKLYEVRGRDD
jgi:hypothetical protein